MGKIKTITQLLALLAFLAATNFALAECVSGESDEGVKNCLTQDLRDSDKRINAVYKILMSNLDEAGKLNLRTQQRAWLKSRDKACALDSKEPDREKWLQAILSDEKKTMCVVRYTFARVGELNQSIQKNAPGKTADEAEAPRAPQWNGNNQKSGPSSDLPASLVFLDDGYKAFTANSHERGKWYYEIWIDRSQIAKMGDLLITPGYFSKKTGAIRMINIRHTQSGMGPIVMGMALDLNGGYVYMRQNGEWKIAPGVAGAVVMPMNTAYVGGAEASSEIRELIRRGLVKINVGERPFENPAPDGYRAWGES